MSTAAVNQQNIHHRLYST